MLKRTIVLSVFFALALAACSSSGTTDVVASDTSDATSAAATEVEATTEEVTAEAADDTEEEAADTTTDVAAEPTEVAEEETEETASSGSSYGGTTTTTAAVDTFTIDVWADNWMAVYVDGVLIGEDSVPITTERSFNSETFTFEAAYPFTLAIEAKDYRETDSGLEYIGESNQQMGDGGIIAQVKDSSGAVVAVTDGDWTSLVVHRAPLNTDCEGDADPNTTCEYEISDVPADWTAVDFDDSAWTTASIWSATDVDPKIGYDDISWDAAAQFLWGTDLLVDNTVLLRSVVAGG